MTPPVSSAESLSRLRSQTHPPSRSALRAALSHALDTDPSIVTVRSGLRVATQANAARLGFRLAHAEVNLVRPGEGLATSL